MNNQYLQIKTFNMKTIKKISLIMITLLMSSIILKGQTGKEVLGDWELIGNELFTDASSIVKDLVTDEDGTMYALIMDDLNLQVYTNDVMGGDWSQLGELNGGICFSAAIKLASDGNPYIAYFSPGIMATIVQRWTGSTWEPLGDPIGQSIQVGFALDSENTPYVAVQAASSGSVGICYKFNGTFWTPLGEYTDGITAVWNQMRIDSNDNIFVLWGAWDNSYETPSYVSKYDGTFWKIVGVETCTPGHTVYYEQDLILDESGNPVVSFIADLDQDIYVSRFDGNSWSYIGEAITGTATENLSMAITDNNNILINYIEDPSGIASALRYNLESWEYLGTQGFPETIVSTTQIAANGNTPIAVFADENNGGKATAKEYTLTLPNIYIITATSGDNGDISQGGSVYVMEGGSQSYTITPDENYVIFELFIDGESVEVNYEYTFEDVMSNHTIEVIFQLIEGVPEQESNFRIYPNPATDIVYIQSTLVTDKVQLLNFVGQIILEQNSSGNKNEIRTSDFDSGVYFLKVYSNDDVITRKIVIK